MLSRTSVSRGASSPEVAAFYDPETGSIQYIVMDPQSRKAALIDMVLDFDPASARVSTASAEEILRFVRERQLEIEWILDTHPHADHLSANHWLKGRLGAPTAIGEKVVQVAEMWRRFYNMPNAFDPMRDFDRLFADGDTFSIGSLPVRVLLSPGHTLASVSYVVGSDAAFIHDTLMHVDAGTSRADFPGGSSIELYQSLQTILDLPPDTRLFVGHDYGTSDRKEPAWEATVRNQRANNVHVGGGVSEADFVKLRDDRDATLGLPDRMLFALQVNLRGGRMPDAEADGHCYFKIPADRF